MNFFKNKKGEIELVQKPNLPIIVWFCTLILGFFIKQGTSANLLEIVGFGSLFTWAWLEVFQGVNYFRRLFGLVVLIFSIYTRLN